MSGCAASRARRSARSYTRPSTKATTGRTRCRRAFQTISTGLTMSSSGSFRPRSRLCLKLLWQGKERPRASANVGARGLRLSGQVDRVAVDLWGIADHPAIRQKLREPIIAADVQCGGAQGEAGQGISPVPAVQFIVQLLTLAFDEQFPGRFRVVDEVLDAPLDRLHERQETRVV